MGWRKLKNGELLQMAEENGFEVFVTGDQTLVYEQNLAGKRLAILALSLNNWPIIKDYVGDILTAIDSAVRCLTAPCDYPDRMVGRAEAFDPRRCFVLVGIHGGCMAFPPRK